MPARYDPRRPDVIADPFPSYQVLRAEDPVHWSDSLGGWVLTRYDDVKSALLDRRFSADRITPFAKHLSADSHAGHRRPAPGARRLGGVHRPAQAHAASRRHEYRVYLARHREPGTHHSEH